MSYYDIDIENKPAAGQRELTFGIELEFIAVIPRKTANKAGSVEDYVRGCLKKARVALPCDNPDCEEKEHKFFLPMEKRHTWDATDFWKLTVDSSAILNQTEKTYDERSSPHGTLELISRIQRFGSSTPCPLRQTYPCDNTRILEWTWRDEIKAFTEVLGQIFSKHGFRALVNENTGFHVHIGQCDEGLPVSVVSGLTGTMLALERCFDSILPTNRISGDDTPREPLPGLDIDGFHALYKPGEIRADWDFASQYCGALTRALFRHVRRRIEDIATGKEEFYNSWGSTPNSPDWEIPGAPKSAPYAITTDDVKSIEEYLSGFNVPSWLEYLKNKSTIDEVKHVGGISTKYSALNCRGLGEDICLGCPKTAEVRLGAGTLDYTEISAWVDLMCNLSLWTKQTDKDELFDYLLQSWRDADYTICDLARKVNASEDTIGLFSYMLMGDDWSPNRYAQDRFEKQTSPDRNPADKLNALTLHVEKNRRAVSARTAVDEKIRWKLESGRYGQLPTSFLQAQPNPTDLMRPEAKFLHLDEKRENGWIEFMQEYYQNERKLKLTIDEKAEDSGSSSGSVLAKPKGEDKSEDEDKPEGEDKAEGEDMPEGGDKSEGEDKPEGGDKSEGGVSLGGDDASVDGGASEESEIDAASSNDDKSEKAEDVESESNTPDGSPLQDQTAEAPEASEAPESVEASESAEPVESVWSIEAQGSAEVDEEFVEASEFIEATESAQSVESEDEYDSDGFYGIHPTLAAAYNAIPGQHLTHLESTVLNMPDLPLPPSPCMAAFQELQHDTCSRLHNNFFRKVTPETIAAADSKDDAERLLAEYVEAEKQMHVLKTCLMEKGAAVRRSSSKKE